MTTSQLKRYQNHKSERHFAPRRKYTEEPMEKLRTMWQLYAHYKWRLVKKPDNEEDKALYEYADYLFTMQTYANLKAK